MPNVHNRGGGKQGSLIEGKNVKWLEDGRGANVDISADVTIGDNSIIDRFVTIITHRHAFEKGVPDKLINKEHPIERCPLVIGSNVLICERATILPQVDYIGDYAIIGYGAVLTKNVEPYEIYGGNPAVKIGKREQKDAVDTTSTKIMG